MEAVSVPFLPIVDRPKLRWPDGKRVAIWVCPNLEHYDYLPPRQRRRDPWPRMPHPDILGYGEKDYGNRVGFWRLVDVMDAHGIRATASGGLTCFERYEDILAACLDREWDCMCHGFENTSYLWDMPHDEEKELIRNACNKFEAYFGKPMSGWFSPAASHTENTLGLLVDAGVRYFCDWYHDEQPFPVTSPNGTIITLPYTMHYNDVIVRLHNQDAEDFVRMVRDAFEVLWRDGADQARVLCLALHPYVSGQPHWLRPLNQLFGELRSETGIWWATGSEIADWYYADAFESVMHAIEAERAECSPSP